MQDFIDIEILRDKVDQMSYLKQSIHNADLK